VGILSIGISFLIPPTFTAKTVFLPPQQPQSAAASALASLGPLSGLAGGALGSVKTTSDQYVSLMQSVNVQDRLIDQFKLMDEYQVKYRFEARKALNLNVRISLGKKDGLITVEVDAQTPRLAADLANAHVAELRRLTKELSLTEAQQRRTFFESELDRTRERLAKAQLSLQRSGFNSGAFKAEPKAAAERYARLKAEVTAAEVKLQTMRTRMANSAPEVQQQQSLLAAIKTQLAKSELGDATDNLAMNADYVGRYRDYKYQEALFELLLRQFEAARLDESRESSLIQVVDSATAPERKSKPRRTSIGLGSTAIAFLLVTIWVLGRFLIGSRDCAVLDAC
jgi:capsule polysaccharide export protein KpsE/RkpR